MNIFKCLSFEVTVNYCLIPPKHISSDAYSTLTIPTRTLQTVAYKCRGFIIMNILVCRILGTSLDFTTYLMKTLLNEDLLGNWPQRQTMKGL